MTTNQYLLDNIEEILTHLNIQFEKREDKLIMSCPIHGGDSNSLYIYTGDTKYPKGNWICFTRHCQNEYGRNFIGFLRGILDLSFTEVLKWLETNFDIQVNKKNLDKNSAFAQAAKIFNKKSNNIGYSLNRSNVIKKLAIPSSYYINRGFSSDILLKYDVGFSTKQMRVVVPIYNDDYTKCIGWTGRSLYEKCPQCSLFHQIGENCPVYEQYKYVKWLNDGFSPENTLYNFWFSRKYIEHSGYAILVEGQGDVWKLEECNIHNCVGMFGCSLNHGQANKLMSCGIDTIYLILDKDNTGKKAAKRITEQYSRYFNVKSIPIINNKKDVGEMNKEEILEIYEKYIINQR